MAIGFARLLQNASRSLCLYTQRTDFNAGFGAFSDFKTGPQILPQFFCYPESWGCPFLFDCLGLIVPEPFRETSEMFNPLNSGVHALLSVGLMWAKYCDSLP
jgi:hypothetical protein